MSKLRNYRLSRGNSLTRCSKLWMAWSMRARQTERKSYTINSSQTSRMKSSWDMLRNSKSQTLLRAQSSRHCLTTGSRMSSTRSIQPRRYLKNIIQANWTLRLANKPKRKRGKLTTKMCSECDALSVIFKVLMLIYENEIQTKAASIIS